MFDGKVNRKYPSLEYCERTEAVKIYAYNGRCNVSGRNVRVTRERMKLSQEQLAARMQVQGVPLTQKAISRIETGERVVADYELMLLAKALNTSVTALLDTQ